MTLLNRTILLAAIPFMSTWSNAQALTSEEKCLALNIYHEARSESVLSQLAVGMVVLNRVKHPKFPNSICGVIKHTRYPGRLHLCQFSWYCDGRSDKPKEVGSWHLAVLNALILLHAGYTDITHGALYYHNQAIQWKYAKAYTMTRQLGSHLFYRQ